MLSKSEVKQIFTPQGNLVEFPNPAIEAKVREEIAHIKGRGYRNSPNLSFVVTAIDRTAKNRDGVIKEILNIAENDVALYWESDSLYLEKQQQIWKPLIENVNQSLGVNFKETFDLSGTSLSDKDKETLENWLTQLDDFKLTAFAYMTSLCHSFLIPFGCVDTNKSLDLHSSKVDCHVGPKAALLAKTDSLGQRLCERSEAIQEFSNSISEQKMLPSDMLYSAELHEHIHREKWGEDPITLKRSEAMLCDLEDVCNFWQLLEEK